MSDLVIRRAEPGDAERVLALRRVWSEEQHGRIEDPDYDKRFVQWWEQEYSRRRTWLAELSEVPIGSLNLTVVDRMPQPGQPAGRCRELRSAWHEKQLLASLQAGGEKRR